MIWDLWLKLVEACGNNHQGSTFMAINSSRYGGYFSWDRTGVEILSGICFLFPSDVQNPWVSSKK